MKGLRNQQELKNTKGAKIVGKISSSPMIGGQRHSGGVEGVGASIWGMGHCTHTGVKLMNFDVVGNGEAFLGYLIVFPRFFFSDVPKHQLILSVRSIKHRRMSREERHGRLWFFFLLLSWALTIFCQRSSKWWRGGGGGWCKDSNTELKRRTHWCWTLHHGAICLMKNCQKAASYITWLDPS